MPNKILELKIYKDTMLAIAEFEEEEKSLGEFLQKINQEIQIKKKQVHFKKILKESKISEEPESKSKITQEKEESTTLVKDTESKEEAFVPSTDIIPDKAIKKMPLSQLKKLKETIEERLKAISDKSLTDQKLSTLCFIRRFFQELFNMKEARNRFFIPNYFEQQAPLNLSNKYPNKTISESDILTEVNKLKQEESQWTLNTGTALYYLITQENILDKIFPEIEKNKKQHLKNRTSGIILSYMIQLAMSDDYYYRKNLRNAVFNLSECLKHLGLQNDVEKFYDITVKGFNFLEQCEKRDKWKDASFALGCISIFAFLTFSLTAIVFLATGYSLLLSPVLIPLFIFIATAATALGIFLYIKLFFTQDLKNYKASLFLPFIEKFFNENDKENLEKLELDKSVGVSEEKRITPHIELSASTYSSLEVTLGVPRKGPLKNSESEKPKEIVKEGIQTSEEKAETPVEEAANYILRL